MKDWKEVAKQIVPQEYQKFLNSRNPNSVKFADIKTDVNRRDLTINALFYDIDADKIVDLVGGEKDIRSGTIRTVGDPAARFGEDPLRKLRALRFYARMGKKIDSKTLHALRDSNLEGISPERIRDEFIKSISGAKSPSNFLKLAEILGYMHYFLGNLSYNKDFSNNSDHEVQLGVLLRDESVQNVKNELSRLKYSREEIRNVIAMIEINNTVKNSDFDNIYQLHRLLSITDIDKIKKFGKEVGISRFIYVLGKIDPKNVDMVNLTSRFKKDALGNAIKNAVRDQFLQLYQI